MEKIQAGKRFEKNKCNIREADRERKRSEREREETDEVDPVIPREAVNDMSLTKRNMETDNHTGVIHYSNTAHDKHGVEDLCLTLVPASALSSLCIYERIMHL